jgi:hypothetical protein
MRTSSLAVLLWIWISTPSITMGDKIVYVPQNGPWKLLQGTGEASQPDISAWTRLDYDDSGWAWNTAPFGYDADGDYGPFGTDLALLDPPMRSNYSCIYLRTSFNIPEPTAVTSLQIDINYDDAAVVWINGAQVARINAEGDLGDPVPANTLMRPCHTADSWENYQLDDPSQYLVQGENILAVQVIQCSITSSDLMFDMELYDPFGMDEFPPVITSIRPIPGLTLRNLDEVEIEFDETVLNVDAADLLVNESPCSSVSGDGRGPYLFQFPAQAPGTVEIRWADNHGITDDSPNLNAFVAGAPWTFTIDPDLPPADLVISEFLASNGSSILDEDGDTEDWIEIWNRGAESIQLGGWSLTDDDENPSRWTFPERLLQPGEYLVVFASAKDRTPTNGSPLHTNFKLNLSGEYLALFAPDDLNRPVFEFAPEFPEQRTDHSYGLTATGEFSYLVSPTPGSPNLSSDTASGFCEAPVFSQERGFYNAPFQLMIASATPGAAIYYTLDGSEPTKTNGTLYNKPIEVAGSSSRAVVTVRATAFHVGMLPSLSITHSYVFPASVLNQPDNPGGFPSNWNGFPTDYEMDPQILSTTSARELAIEGLGSLPVVSIVTDTDNLFSASSGIYANSNNSGPAWERPVSAELFFPDGSQEGFQLDCGLRIQGGSSVVNFKSIKLSMRMLFKDDYGYSKLEYKLYPDSPVEQFDTLILDAGLNLTWTHPDHGQRVRAQYVRDQYVSDIENAMGQPAPHGRFVHVFLNGLYWGMYDLHEKPDHSFSAEYFGGEKEDYDAFKHRNSSDDLLNGDTIAWEAARAIAAGDLSDYNRYLDLAEYVDLVNLADYMIANLWAGNTDWAHQNWYASRHRSPEGRFRFYSWDAEHTLKSVSENRIGVSNTWSPAEFYDRLRNKSAEWRLLFADRVFKHFFNGGVLYVDPSNPDWDPTQPQRNMPAALYMQRIDEIFTAIQCESARWGDAEINTSPNIRYTRNEHWMNELNWVLEDYMPERSQIVLNQFRAAGLYPDVDAPVLSIQSGDVPAGTGLRFQRAPEPNAVIYYTLDGSDPRTPGTGQVSPAAQAYSTPIIINEHTIVTSRVLSNGTWSALNEAVFTVPQDLANLRISEIMFNPLDGRLYEFLELHNSGATVLDLSGVSLDGGVQYIFAPGTFLASGAHLVLVNDPISFSSRYPDVPVHGAYEGNLANDGESVTLLDAEGAKIETVLFDDTDFWPLGADGFGFSLVRLDGDQDPESPFAWTAGAVLDGTPGEPETLEPAPPVYFSEVLARVEGDVARGIELVNLNAFEVAIGGWAISDSRDSEEALKRFIIPSGVILPPGERYAISGADLLQAGVMMLETGGELYLSSLDSSSQLTGMITGIDYECTDPNRSYGLHQASHELQYVPLVSPTLGTDSAGAENAPPFVGDVVISEIMYHPLVPDIEYIELYNQSADPVTLFDPESNTGWRLNGVQQQQTTTGFLFSPGDTIPARTAALVTGIEPDTFRTQFAIPAHVPIFGPYDGGIDNSGERLRLSKPEWFPGVEPVTAYLTQDQVRFNDKAPWPVEADGLGASLQRIVLWTHGDEPENWMALDDGNPGEVPIASVEIDIVPGSGADPWVLRWAGTNDTVYQVQWSIDLAEWNDAGTAPVEIEPGLYEWTDPDAVQEMKFYRVIKP